MPFQSEVTLHTDASNSGWGGVLSSGPSTSGLWSTSEKEYHINFLELKAVYLCVSSFLGVLKDSSLQIFSDNMTTVFYINKVGGTQSTDLCLLALDLWKLLDCHNIKCFACHIPGKQNTIADAHSRSEGDRHDYYICETTFSSILSALPFTPSFDLFASRLTYKLPSYASRLPDPSASFIDAFSFAWGKDLYMFPPLPLIARVVQKIQSDEATNVLLITPAWPALVSLPVILSLLVSNPIFIPSSHLLGQPPTRYPFNMMAWPISKSAADTSSYQLRLAQPCPPVSQSKLSLLTSDTGGSFVHMLNLKGHKVICLSP